MCHVNYFPRERLLFFYFRKLIIMQYSTYFMVVDNKDLMYFEKVLPIMYQCPHNILINNDKYVCFKNDKYYKSVVNLSDKTKYLKIF